MDLVTLLGKIESLIEKNNTTTSSYDISSGLNERVVGFLKGTDGLSGRASIPKNLYPYVFTELVSKEEDFAQVGNSSNRDTVTQFRVIPVTDYGLGSTVGASEGLEVADLELIKLAQNIENLLRAKISLSSTVDHILISNTEYGTIFKEPKTYNAAATINLEVTWLQT